MVDYLKDLHHIEIQIDGSALPEQKQGMPITMNLRGVSMAAAFQRFEDEKFGELKFVVRDYGILVTTPTRAQEAGYMPVAEFLRLRTEVSKADLLEAQKRLAELVKVLEAGGTEAEVGKLARAAQRIHVCLGQRRDCCGVEGSFEAASTQGKRDPEAKKAAAAVPKPHSMAPQTARLLVRSRR